MKHTTDVQPAALGRRALLWHAFAALALGGLGWSMGSTAHAAASATVVEAVQLPAWVERNGQRRPAEPGAVLLHQVWVRLNCVPQKFIVMPGRTCSQGCWA